MQISASQPVTREAIAQALGVPTRLVERWESGQKELLLTPVQAHKLCNILHVTPKELADMYHQGQGDQELLLTPGQFHHLCTSFDVSSEDFANRYINGVR